MIDFGPQPTNPMLSVIVTSVLCMVVGVMLHRARARVRKQLGDYLGESLTWTNSIPEGEGRAPGRD